MQRRQALALLSACAAVPAWANANSEAAPSDDTTLIIAAWRGAQAHGAHHVGVLEADWRAREVRVRWQHAVPTRAHGFEIDRHGIVAVALRPGAWLMRFAPDGCVLARARPAERSKAVELRFNGHAVTSRDGLHLYATMTDAVDGQGWIGVHDAATLEPIDAWPSHGVEPHQLLLDGDGPTPGRSQGGPAPSGGSERSERGGQHHLMVAHGGIRRGSDDRKLDLDRMESSLVRIDPRDGRLIGRWQLDDRRLSLRHLAWSAPGDNTRALLGIALQAEHDDPARRREAPALAVWDGKTLSVPTPDAQAQGHAGDIAPAAGGGFVISNARAAQVLWWQPAQPSALHAVARLQEAYALTAWPREGEVGALVAAARGIGRWHPTIDPAMLPWPQAMALDNHWLRFA